MSFIRRSRIKKSIVKWLRYCFTFEFWDKYGFLQISFLHTVLQCNSSVLFTAWRKSGISWKEKPLIEFSASFFWWNRITVPKAKQVQHQIWKRTAERSNRMCSELTRKDYILLQSSRMNSFLPYLFPCSCPCLLVSLFVWFIIWW